MSTFHRYGLALLACVLVLAFWQLAPAQGEKEKAVQKWEYLGMLFADDDPGENAKAMTAQGERGWELVTVVSKPRGGQAAYFKRPK